MKVEVIRKQWPVGQGCFSSASIMVDNQAFEYIYDCGSQNLGALRTCLDAYSPNSHRVDALFISHLDSDHVNGLDYLLGTTDLNIDSIFLPYLTNKDIILIVGHALSEGAFSGNLLEFVSNPSEWLTDRGAKNIFYIRRQPEEGSEFNEGDISEPPPFKEKVNLTKPDKTHSRLLIVANEQPSMTSDKLGSSIGAKTLSSDTVIGAVSSVGLIWVLLPYVPPMPELAIAHFFNEVEKQGFPVDNDELLTSELIDALRDPNRRSRLRESYSHLANDHNYVSLCLYSGPSRQNGLSEGFIKRFTQIPHSFHHFYRTHLNRGTADGNGAGWLGTGDAKLKSSQDIKNLTWRYRHYLREIGVLMAPHHGSHRNFSVKVLDNIIPRMVFASAGSNNSYGHPHTRVVDQVTARGHQFHIVSEDPQTILVERLDFQV